MSADLLREAAALMRERAEDQAAHIAGMSPAVALAVADWLEASADVVEAEDRDRCGPGLGTRRALAVARAYLGSAS